MPLLQKLCNEGAYWKYDLGHSPSVGGMPAGSAKIIFLSQHCGQLMGHLDMHVAAPVSKHLQSRLCSPLCRPAEGGPRPAKAKVERPTRVGRRPELLGSPRLRVLASKAVRPLHK
jgi:hypothetical protein